MEAIEGERCGSSLFADEYKFIYLKNKTRVNELGTKTYLKCKHPHCRGASILFTDLSYSISQPHNHPANVEEYYILKFKSALRRRAETENLNFIIMFREEEILHPEASPYVCYLTTV